MTSFPVPLYKRFFMAMFFLVLTH